LTAFEGEKKGVTWETRKRGNPAGEKKQGWFGSDGTGSVGVQQERITGVVIGGGPASREEKCCRQGKQRGGGAGETN